MRCDRRDAAACRPVGDDPDGEGVRRGWIRVVGIVPSLLMATFAIVRCNLRTLLKGARHTGFDNGDPRLGHLRTRTTTSVGAIDETPHGAIDPPIAA